MFNGKLGLVRIFDKCLTPREVFYEYMVDRVLFMKWYERLWYFTKLTFLMLMGK